jgi:predicted phage tail protein
MRVHPSERSGLLPMLLAGAENFRETQILSACCQCTKRSGRNRGFGNQRMKIVNLLINENVLKAELELEQATSENIVQFCRNYLALLTEYRDQLFSLRDIPELNLEQQSALARELVEQARRAVRAAVEITVKERNRTEALLASFTKITISEAAATFNLFSYKGHTNWQAGSAGVQSADGTDVERISVEEAVATAGRLRREAYVMNKMTSVQSISAHTAS